ncbi:response regulator [Microvirga sp. P5_D2]
MSTASTPSAHKATTPSQTILVVEDEVLIRLVIADYLRGCGYRIYEAVNAAEAIEILQSREVPIDIVFSDVEMPGTTDGFELARWIRAHKPGVQVLLTSSIERSADIAASLCEEGPLLRKPYPTQAVVDQIKQLIARAERGIFKKA